MTKKLALMCGVVLGLLLLAVMIVPFLLPPEAYKNVVIGQIQKATGRQVTVKGAMDIRVFPSAGVHMEDVIISNPAGFSQAEPFMTLKALSVHIALMPLLAHKIEIKDFTLDTPVINLVKRPDQSSNWQLPSGKPATSAPQAQKQSSAANEMLLGDVRIKDGTVLYTADAGKTKWDVKNLDLDLSMESRLKLDGSADWNGKPVKLEASASSLPALMEKSGDSNIELRVKSDLLTLESKGAVSNKMYTGKIDVRSSSLKSLQAWINPKSETPGVAGALALAAAGDIACSDTLCDAKNLDLTLDKMQAKGSVKYTKGSDRPNLDIKLAMNTLDLNTFMAPQKQADAAGWLMRDARAEAVSGWSDEVIDLSGLRALNATAEISVDELLYKAVKVSKTIVRASLKNGHLEAGIADAGLYGGTGTLSATLDSAGAVPAFTTRIFLKAINAAALLKDADITDRISGKADFTMLVAAQGKSQRQMISDLQGSGNFKLNDGAIQGVNILNIARQLQSALTMGEGGGGSTPITDMNGTYAIKDGIVNNQDLVMTTPDMRMGGKGTINLPARMINYRLEPQLVRNVKDAEGKTTQAAGLAVPVVIDGSLDHPHFRPDAAGVLKNALENPEQFKQQLKNSRGSLKDQLKDPKKALKDLKGMFR